MRRIIFIIAAFIVAGCGRNTGIEFCEGVSPEGKGVNCGTAFHDGDVTAIVSTAEPFGVRSIRVRVYPEANPRDAVDSIDVEVRPDAARAVVNLPMYAGGRYLVRAFKNDSAVAEGKVEIVEE